MVVIRRTLRLHPVAALLLAGSPATATTGEQVFDVFEYRVLGNTVLETRAVERAVYPHLGERRRFEDVQAAAAALEQAYRDAGYSTVFVDVPEQDVGGGIVRLRVSEARIGQVRVTGARNFSSREIAASVPALAPGAVPNFPRVQQQLAVVNRRSPDLQVTPVLKTGAAPGTVDVELKAKDALPAHVAVEVNDRYTADTSRTRASLTAGYDAMFGRPHSLSLQFQTAPENPDDTRVLAATYVARDPGSGRALAFYAIDSDSDVATVGALSVLGKGQMFGTRYIIPLELAAERTSSLTLGLDYKDFDETVEIDAENTLVTPISYLSASLAFGQSRVAESWQFSGSIGPRFGWRGEANGENEFADKRYLARPNFFYLAGDAQYQHLLPGGYALALRTSGQYSTEPLVSNEQFSIGGFSTVRGYLESEQLGDYGIAGSVELLSPQLAARIHPAVQDARLYAFLDGGYAAIHDPLPDQEDAFDLASLGVGLRMTALETLALELGWGYPLLDGARTESGDDRLMFSVRYGL